jgi:hypothetical protein
MDVVSDAGRLAKIEHPSSVGQSSLEVKEAVPVPSSMLKISLVSALVLFSILNWLFGQFRTTLTDVLMAMEPLL